MTMQTIDFEGQQHQFPDDFSQADIAKALGGLPKREDVTAGMALRGVPVLGAYVPQAEAAIRAATGQGQGQTFGERYANILPQRQALYQRAEEESPIASGALKFGGGAAALGPLGATATGARALGISGPTLAGRLGWGLSSGAGISAADAAARGEPVGPAAAVGGIGGAGGAAVGRALEALPGAITGTRGGAARAADVATLEREGIPLSAGQRTGHRPLQIAEEEAANIFPWGQTPQERAKEAFTQAAARRAGINAENLRPEVMDKALNDFNRAYRGFAARNDVNNNAALQQLGVDMRQTLQGYTRMIGPQGPTGPRDYVARIIDVISANNGTIPGEAYQAIRFDLGQDARRALKGANPNYHLGDALYELQGSLDNAMGRSMAAAGSPDQAAWQQVNRWYRNFLPIERGITGAGEEARWGLLSPMALRAALVNMQGRRAFGRGAGDLAELAGAGESVMKGFPQSGTSARQFWSKEAPFALGTMAHGLVTANPWTLGTGLLALGTPPAGAAAILSRPVQRYLGGRPTALPAIASELGSNIGLQMTPEGYPFYQR